MQAKLYVRHFNNGDIETLNEWLRARKLGDASAESLPAAGFIVSDEETPVAVCFVRRCEGNYGIIEGLATNPECDSALRHEAIDTAIYLILEYARLNEMTEVFAWSRDDGTLKRTVERFGFEKMPETLLSKRLGISSMTC